MKTSHHILLALAAVAMLAVGCGEHNQSSTPPAVSVATSQSLSGSATGSVAAPLSYHGRFDDTNTLTSTNRVPAFGDVHVGMSRDDVYRMLGKPQGILAQGVRDVYSEIWVGPTDSHGSASRLSVLFWADGKAHDVKTDTVKLK